MKALFLENLSSMESAESAIDSILFGQKRPWVLFDDGSDAIAYFRIEAVLDGEPNIHVVAEISGRHYDSDSRVVSVLTNLQSLIGGTISKSA